MRPETLLYAIGEVDDDAVRDARDPKLKRPHRWRRWLVTAACLRRLHRRGGGRRLLLPCAPPRPVPL